MKGKKSAMASLATGIIDPTKVGKYRVVLSDALLGKDPKELYTGIRYNHKPSLSSSTAPHQARIKPTGSTDSSTAYDLSFQHDGGRYAYQGSRGHEDNQFVLIFDPEREVFVLHRVDSMFNMNLVRTPTNNDAEDLRQEYPHLETHLPSRTTKATNKGTSSKPAKPTKPKKPVPKDAKPLAAKKAEPPAPTQTPKSNKVHHDSEEESSDDDLLTIEVPGGAAPASNRDFSPGFIDKPRRFSEFVQQQSEEEGEEEEDGDFEIEVEAEAEALNDADGEEEEEEDDDEPEEHFTLPSPVHRQMMSQNINGGGGGGHSSVGTTTQSALPEQESDEDEDEKMEDVGGGGAPVAQDDVDDLEAMLMAELENEEVSEVSEED
ncbi:RNA polymerase II transcription elongation factor-domain-containing protein [Xylaria sp. FL1042]|nr:RNA polymerase II transcription elongation factor-domain-containing protein [Xylaria sp. FL1042]